MPAKAWRRPRIRWRALAAIETLRAGGTAADAAVTAVALLGVLEPHMTGIGGDCFCLVAKPGAPVWGYNGSGRAGAAMQLEELLAQGMQGTIAQDSIHAVTVPGAVEAWEAILQAHGRFGLDRALAPAIRMARRRLRRSRRASPRLGARGGTAAQGYGRDACTICPAGSAPAVGDMVTLPALAATLETIAEGRRARILQGRDRAGHRRRRSRPRGSMLAAADFAAHRGEEVTPIRRIIAASTSSNCRRTGRGWRRWCCSTFSSVSISRALDPFGAGTRCIIALEAARLAYAVRDTHIADPAFMRMPVPRPARQGLCRRRSPTRSIAASRSQLPQAPAPRGDTMLSPSSIATAWRCR